MAMAGAYAGGDATRNRSRKLQRATFILPKTGERSRRQFTLRDASNRLSTRSSSEDGNQRVYGSGNFGWSAGDKPISKVIWEACRSRIDKAWEFAISPTGQGIFKCSIAYVLGSMATFVPAISGIFGNRQDSKHMVATVAVYFHPARTIGSMHEATVIAAVSFLYAALISGGSMALSIFFAHHDLLALGHAMVLIVFVAGGFGFMAFIKQYLGNPLLNVGCSLASLATINILIREGSVQAGVFSMYKVTQNLGMTILGVVIAAVVNFLVFPVLARKKLPHEMEKNTDLLGEMLISIARAFLHGREHDLDDEYYKTLFKEHQTSLNTMRKNLKDAKKEHYVLGNERIYAAEAKIVDCLNGLSQDLGGLRSAAFAQFAFLKQSDASGGGTSPVEDRAMWLSSPTTPAANSNEASHYFSNLDIIRESPEERPNVAPGLSMSPEQAQANGFPNELQRTYSMDFATPGGTATPTSIRSADGIIPTLPRNGSLTSVTATNIAKSPGDMFVAFISQLGPPTKSLVFTLKQVLDELPFQSSGPSWNPWAARDLEVAVNEQFHASLREAIELYRQSRKDALNFLLQNRAINTAVMAQRGFKSSFSTKAPSTPTSSSPTETRHQAPKHAKTLFNRDPEDVLADIEEVSACCGHFSFSLLDFAQDVLNYLDILEDLKDEMEAQRRSWRWLMFWRRNETQAQNYNTLPEGNEDPADARFNIPSPVRKADHFGDQQRPDLRRPWYYKIYKAFRFLRRDDVRFAIKVGLGAALYALPAFLEETRPFFLYWRGEWGLVSYMVVCSMTVGAVNTTGFNRIYGSAIGAFVAAIAWIISNHEGVANPWLLGFFGWLMSLVGFYIIVAKDNGPMGRFIFLSYNLVALYSYSLSTHDDDNDDDEGGIDPAIWQIALHRLVSVSVGTIWAIIVVRCIAPISARRKLREGLCTLWLRMGLIWKRDPLAMSLLGEPKSAYMDIREESELQSFLASLRSIRKAANAEFDFQGPFPDASIGKIMDRCGRMLDAFHAMNVVISKNLTCTPGEAAVLRYTRPERFALSARISHLFTVLASSIKLEYPLNDVLPSINDRRDRLLAKISKFRVTGEGREVTTEQDYEMLYAYVLVTGQLAQDIEVVGMELETLYGALNEENLKLH